MKSKEYLIKLNKSLALIPISLITLSLLSCFADYSFSPEMEALNLLDYYKSNPRFKYNLSSDVVTVPFISQTKYEIGQEWTFVEFYQNWEFLYDNLHTYKIVSAINDTTIIVKYTESKQPDSFNSISGTINIIDTIIVMSSHPIEYMNMFPIPPFSELSKSTKYIQMDDGSICYRGMNGAVYSNTLGFLYKDSSEDDETHTLVQKNNTLSIPYLIQEFLEKEKALESNQ